MQIDPDWRGLRRGPDGELLWNGSAIFGHMLPRLGMVDFPCFADGETVDAIGAATCSAAFVRRGFVVEWLGAGLCLAFGQVRPRG